MNESRHMYESCHLGMDHVTYEWVMSQEMWFRDCCRMSHVTYELSHVIYKLSHATHELSHVTYE